MAGAIWGLAFIAQVEGLEHIGPFLFVGLRFLLAALVLLPFFLLESRRLAVAKGRAASYPVAREWRGFVLIGFALFFGMAFQQVGLMTTSVTNSGFLTGLYVVFTPLLGLVIFGQRPHPVIWVGAALSFIGIFLLSGGEFERLVIGDFLTIVSAVFWALQVLLIAHLLGNSERAMGLAFVQFLVTGLAGMAVALVVEPIELEGILKALPSLAYAGVIAGGLAFTLQVIGQRHTTAPQAVLFLATEAPFAALFGFLFRNERIGTPGLLGCTLILVAILLVELLPMLRQRRDSVSNG